MIDLALLFLGLILVALFAKLTLDNAIVIAHHFNIPDFYMGALILAIGSDLPELVVTLNAAIRNLGSMDTSGLIIGNAIGSCFGQIGLSLGVAGCFGYLTIARKYMLRHGQVLLGSLVALFLAGLDGSISRVEGGALTALYVLYVFSLIDGVGQTENNTHSGYRPLQNWGLLAVGLGGVVLAEEKQTKPKPRELPLSSFIGIAIIGVGTSIPELSIAIAALAKARGAMSVGNIIGSNILDTLLPVGLAGLIAPLVFESGLLWFDLPALFVLSAVVFLFFMRKRGLQRREAMILVTLYAVYIFTKLASA